MFRLHLLGGARIEGDDGRVGGEAAQRHRLGLLALLAVAPRGIMAREKLCAMLWPEHGAQEARHLLNMCVHVLRRALGGSVLHTEGADLRLDVAALPSDVAAFRDAAARGDEDAALASYQGPFLDGFFLDRCAEFDRWQAEERDRLAQEFSAVLERRGLSAAAAGDHALALQCWRRLAQLEPGSGRATVRLMLALEAQGDPAGALAAADAHRRVMAEDFGAEPSPEVLDLRTRISAHPVGNRVSPEGVGTLEPFGAVPHVSAGAHGLPATLAQPRARHWFWWGGITGAAALAGVIVATGMMRSSSDREPGGSLAVLPFADLSPEHDRAYLADGVTEELLTALARVPWLHVASRSSSFRFRGPAVDVRTAGRRLHVAAVVEGSLRVDGDRLRVAAQLIDTRTGYQLWSQEFDRNMADVFAVQEEIAHAVATALSARLAEQLRDTLVTPGTKNLQAHDFYLRGRHAWNLRTREGMEESLQMFQRAIALDHSYAAAYAGLADAWQLLPDYADLPTREGLANAKAAALRAIALDSTLADAYASLGAVLDDYDHNRAGSEAAYRRAIELNPGYATAHHWLAIHLADEGRAADAYGEIEHARSLDPLSPIINTAAGAVHYLLRDNAGAIAEYQNVLTLHPDFALAWALLGRVYLVTGQTAEAVTTLKRSVDLSGGDPSYRAIYAAALAAAGHRREAQQIARELQAGGPGSYVPYCELASAYLYMGDDDAALRLYRTALIQRGPAVKHLAVDALHDRIRGDPRFTEVLRQAGFPPGVGTREPRLASEDR